MSEDQQISAAECPVQHGRPPRPGQGGGNQQWWPHQLNLKVLARNGDKSDPYAPDFDYAAAFRALDLDAVRADITAVLTDSRPWWPADYGHYGPFFVRMAWHAAGTYRVGDGRGGAGHGQQRFAPLNSWPDNAGLDKARRLLWPVKKKYGKNLSWGDLLIFAGNVALEDMGLKTFGFAGGRVDEWEPDEDVYWGPETVWLDDERYTGERDLQDPLAAVQMGLIYVNPEGPNGDPDPLKAAVDVRETFKRMAMDDTETLALIAGGHTFGKTHGNSPAHTVGPAPEAAPMQAQGLGWVNTHGTGVGIDANSSGLEGAWNSTPKTWDNNFFWTLYGYEWELGRSPAGAQQWHPKSGAGNTSVPDAHDPTIRHAPMMLTTDLALRFDPEYEKISRHFLENPNEFADVFARAWFKLTHRDMGPKTRYLGTEVPAEDLIWQDPIPALAHPVIGPAEVAELKDQIRSCGLGVSQLVATAWAAGSTFRGSDLRGGANGGRLRLAPQRDWEVNEPAQLTEVIGVLESIVDSFNAARTGAVRVSFADVVVLGGAVGIETAAAAAGRSVTVPFTPGRGDTTAELTDVESFGYLEPRADGFRNYNSAHTPLPAEVLLVDKASLLNLTAPEMTVLLGGLRVLGANHGGSPHGVLTDTPEVLTNDFFVNILDMDTRWTPREDGTFVGSDRVTGEEKWTGTRADLVFASNSQLRAFAEVYAANEQQTRFVDEFIAAWNKVMNADRFDMA